MLFPRDITATDWLIFHRHIGSVENSCTVILGDTKQYNSKSMYVYQRRRGGG